MKRCITISLLLFLTLFMKGAIATVWYVNGVTGSDTNPGTVSEPLTSISTAVSLSMGGDVIKVAEGTYQEEVLVEGFDGLSISGGWNVDFSLHNPQDYQTIILDPDPTADTIAFSFLSSINCTLEGFTIQDFYKGVFSNNLRTDIDRSSIVSVYVLNNRMFNQRQYGIHFYSSYLVIEHNEVFGSGYAGIAGHADYSITHADIDGNYIEGSKGYGLYLIGAKQWNISNNYIIGSSSAGMNLNYCCYPKYVLNNTIVYNDGPGIRAGYVPVIYAKNNLVAFNGDYGLKRDGGYIIQPENNLVFGNLPDNYHDWVAAASDIQLDPELDPATYTLTSTSPAIDAGLDLTTTNIPNHPVTDYFGTPRTIEAGGDGLYDIGAHEYVPYIAFQEFNISKAEIKDKKNGYKLSLAGDFIWGADSDGIDILNEDVTITIGDYIEIIPAGAFQWDAVEENYLYIGVTGGITKFVFKQNGTFSCKASDLDLDVMNFEMPVYVALQVGDDMGETGVFFKIK